MKSFSHLKLFTFLILSSSLSSCFVEDVVKTKIKGGAHFIDNFNDKNPLEGLYVEAIYDAADGDGIQILASAVTDKNGYFELEGEYFSGGFNLDNWDCAYVFKDAEKLDTLGWFGFQFADETYKYRTIHIDTFSLEHTIWVKPRILDLQKEKSEGVYLSFYNAKPQQNKNKYIEFFGEITEGKTFEPIEVKMPLNTQHWLNFGTRTLATGGLIKSGETFGSGDWKLNYNRPTKPGDTLFLDFSYREPL